MALTAAYLAGLLTLPALALGTWWGLCWWRALRRSEGALAPEESAGLTLPPVLPPLPQDAPVVSKISFRSIPARKSIRRRRR